MKLRIAGTEDAPQSLSAAVTRLEAALSRHAAPCEHCTGNRVLEDGSTCPVCDIDGLVSKNHEAGAPLLSAVPDESDVRVRDTIEGPPHAWADLDAVLADLQARVELLEAWRANHAGGPPRARSAT
jgi:hypothetical protein